MSIKIIGTTAANIFDTDTNLNTSTRYGVNDTDPCYQSFSTGGNSSGSVVAAALGSGINLMYARMNENAVYPAFIWRYELTIAIATVGAQVTPIGGFIDLFRFATTSPTSLPGAALRQASNKNPHRAQSGMFVIIDSNASLTITNSAIGDRLTSWIIPNVTAGGQFQGPSSHVFESKEDPIVLYPGDGIALQTDVAQTATMTWQFDWKMQWIERAGF